MSEKLGIRDLRQTHHRNMKISDYVSGPVRLGLFGGKDGMEAVFRVAEIDRPLNVGTPEKPFIVSDVGFWWYIFAPRDSFFWLSAAFDRDRELIEIYIDITAGNCFDDPENPCYRDMYLDLVVSPEGKVKVLDRDELSEALLHSKITSEEAEAAEEHCSALEAYLLAHAGEVLEFCRSKVYKDKAL